MPRRRAGRRLGAALALVVAVALVAGSCGLDTRPEGSAARSGSAESSASTESERSAGSVDGALRLGRPIVGRFAAAESERRVYSLEAAVGDALHLVVEQQGIDLVAELQAPNGRRLLTVDTPIGSRGREHLHVVADSAGEHRLRVWPFAAAAEPSGYTVHLVARRPAQPADRVAAEVAQRLARAEELLAGGDAVSLLAARGEYRQALREASGEQVEQALLARGRLAWIAFQRGEPERAVALYAAAIDSARQHELPEYELWLLNESMPLLRRFGRFEHALTTSARALEVARELGELRAEVVATNNRALIERQRGRLWLSLLLYQQALDGWRRLEDRTGEAVTLHNLGITELRLQRFDEARESLRRALELLDDRDLAGTAASLTALAAVEWRSGASEDARRLLDRALALRRRQGDRRGEAVTLEEQASLALATGDRGAAVATLRRVVGIFREHGDRASEAHVLGRLGTLAGERGRAHEAHAHFDAAAALYRELGDGEGEAEIDTARARVVFDVGDPQAALAHLERALAAVETVRRRAVPSRLRSHYAGSKHSIHELHLDILVALHRQSPRAGWALRAFEAADTVRARTLHEDLLAGAEPPLPPALLSVAAVQDEIVDGDTLALVFAVGERESHLFALDRTRLTVHRLPPRRELDSLVHRLHRLLAGTPRRAARMPIQRAAEALGQALLGPVADRLGARRLVLVADGSLHLVPWAALIDPAAVSAQPLVANHELVTVPSLANLAALRRRGSDNSGGDDTSRDRRISPWSVAVVADPVFSTGDPRLGRDAEGFSGAVAGRETVGSRGDVPVAAGPGSARAPEGALRGGDGGYRRLEFSRREAELILALVPPERRWVALDFAADREVVLDGILRDFDIVHFATHGVLHDEPELSGLVLSLVDAAGRPRDGFLRAHEIAGLELSADLVVLGACRSALGEQIAGEGMVGLPRSFLRAGAARVLVSLWDISDPATAELMRVFYQALLERGERPAEALRSAQEALRGDSRWHEPYYWAGFVLQGDWR